jgi:hypothetical protein
LHKVAKAANDEAALTEAIIDWLANMSGLSRGAWISR